MNMGSILIYSGTINKRREKIEKIVKQVDENLVNNDHPDKLTIEKEKGKKSIGIAQIRKLVSFLSTKPFSSKFKVVVVNSADKMTTQAQNALLKTLEEPPFFAIIILSAKTEQSLLPTVLSRCRRIKADREEVDLFGESNKVVRFGKVLKLDVGKRLALAEKLSKKDEEEIIEMMEFWIREERFEMTENQKLGKHKNIELILKFLEDIENTNVNKRLALETLFMNV